MPSSSSKLGNAKGKSNVVLSINQSSQFTAASVLRWSSDGFILCHHWLLRLLGRSDVPPAAFLTLVFGIQCPFSVHLYVCSFHSRIIQDTRFFRFLWAYSGLSETILLDSAKVLPEREMCQKWARPNMICYRYVYILTFFNACVSTEATLCSATLFSPCCVAFFSFLNLISQSVLVQLGAEKHWFRFESQPREDLFTLNS